VGLAAAGCGGGDDGGAGSPTTAAAGAGAGGTTGTDAAEPLDVLVTNDDGYDAEGIDVLVEALRTTPDVTVTVVAPATNQSGTGDRTTPGDLATSERTTASGYDVVAVDGYPADTVTVALDELGLTPDLVVSGINAGQNIGPLVDISGTVGAAKQAQRRGLPALAVSQGLTDGVAADYATAAELAVDWVDAHRGDLGSLADSGEIESLNVPTCPAGEVRGVAEVAVGEDGSHVGDPVDCTSTAEGFADDVAAFLNGYASLTPVPAAAEG